MYMLYRYGIVPGYNENTFKKHEHVGSRTKSSSSQTISREVASVAIVAPSVP
jgi:hypothetical protein